METRNLFEEFIAIGYSEKLRQIQNQIIDEVERTFDSLIDADLNKEELKKKYKEFLMNIRISRNSLRNW